MIPKGAVFANSLIGALRPKPRTALELCKAAASAQRRRWASFVQKRGLRWAKQQVHLDLQTLKRLGIVERVKLMGRCDLWRLVNARTPKSKSPAQIAEIRLLVVSLPSYGLLPSGSELVSKELVLQIIDKRSY